MSFLDIFSTYLYGLKLVAIIFAMMMLISGLDDLFIDIVYWSRRFWRAITVYRNHDHLDYKALYEPAEKPLAIMVPAWHETGVIGKMAELAATTLDYENYHIFVGTYPNDPDTQNDVDVVCARFPNVHKVVCARPGPTSKADCLNNVLDAIQQFEHSAKFEFAGFILHDAEDVISDMELRLFNYLIDRKDLIQIPVYPFERTWTNFTSLSYLDEFAELHGKDVPVREALAGQVPSAGVGTCFSRRAVLALLADGDGIAFDVQSLTEDYDIGFRLKEKGMKEIFVRFPVIRESQRKGVGNLLFGQNERDSNVICVREYFPDTMQTAVRQKSRWIIGIVYQGFKTHRWTSNWTLNYFLWRDRKGAISNFVSFIASLILLQLLGLWLYQRLWPDAYHFLSIFEGDIWLVSLLWINFLLMSNRMLQRIIFVSGYYGLSQGLMALPRLFWGNLINFLANWRALSQIIAQGDPRRVAWDKTTHDFPSVGGENRARHPLGQILIEQGVLTQAQLEAALAHRIPGLRLGSCLVHEGVISAEQLARAVAVQSHVDYEPVDAYALSEDLVAKVPAPIALHYVIVPVREEGDTLVVASESDIDPVSMAALSRKLDRPVRYVIAAKGQVAVGLRRWYVRAPQEDPRALLDAAVAAQLLDRARAEDIWQSFVSMQVLLAEILMSLGHIGLAALNALLLRHERSDLTFGQFLVDEGVISSATLDEALRLQRELQPDMRALLQQNGIGVDALDSLRPAAAA
ncbi:cyclic di-3',5'-guanylate-activated glycosyltransferase NrfB [Jeongeupia naejangsanensis]|uniref:Phage adsorption protein NrfB n=1 Tax=Jeongeupia naejangsanensis TaxID=613195 RepID=A0ABS2BIG6_9NEIS|nr:cyclic di-3',5'-guanylate-activated glycosyltransferase NrfB [Jeongeupia naejangsanensis]MBM3114756.1 phage adsorption protein NrfB [Jeongeupia naejangsanensis]